MKIKYNYFSLRFPDEIALLCLRIREIFNAKYIDFPILLPVESKFCEYRNTEYITYESRVYFVANERMDVHIIEKSLNQERYFGVINISRDICEYVLWTNFYDKTIESLLSTFKGNSDIRIYKKPIRISATLKCDDANV